MDDLLGQAVYDHYRGHTINKLWIYNQYGPREEMPVAAYFREEDDMPDLEWLALNECRGRVLDIGAGAGSHALALQQRGADVTALDISRLLVEVMRGRGVEKVIEEDIYKYTGASYDTLLLLMNGIGLAGSTGNLKVLLNHFKTLLSRGGQVLFDSSDVAYLYDADKPTDRYYGEITYRYSYNKVKTDWFNWLYVDEHTMKRIAEECGFVMTVLLEDEFGQYLARLTAG